MQFIYDSFDLQFHQEVQKSHLNDIQQRLRSLNYDVIYKKRTGDKVNHYQRQLCCMCLTICLISRSPTAVLFSLSEISLISSNIIRSSLNSQELR